jgi:polysaccharide pyruvyl transferase WcaK-like protein
VKLLHLANYHSTNIGNGALISGTERVLREDLGADLTFAPAAWDDYTFGLKPFDEAFVHLVNATDGLIVGGMVTLNGRPYLKNTGMRFDLPLELWSRIVRPIVFYGISYRVWPGQPYHNLDALKRAMDHVLTSPTILFSVRNDGTKEWLETLLGFESERIAVIPDPTLYVPVTDAWHPELEAGKTNVIVSLNDEDSVERFGGEDRRRRFVSGLAAALDEVARQRDINIILCPHYFDDYRIIGELLSACSLPLAYQRSVSTGVIRVERAAYFYDLYAKADAVLSMRVHSMTPAIGLGVPCVPLISQTRMSEFIKDAGLQDLAVDVFDADLSDTIITALRRCLDCRDEVTSRLIQVRRTMRERTRCYNERIAALLSA